MSLYLFLDLWFPDEYCAIFRIQVLYTCFVRFVPSVSGVGYFIFYVHVFIASTVDFFYVFVLYPMNLLNSLFVVFLFCRFLAIFYQIII